MEAALLLINFTGIVLLVLWSSKADKAGTREGRQGLFAYNEPLETPLPGAQRPPGANRKARKSASPFRGR